MRILIFDLSVYGVKDIYSYVLYSDTRVLCVNPRCKYN